MIWMSSENFRTISSTVSKIEANRNFHEFDSSGSAIGKKFHLDIFSKPLYNRTDTLYDYIPSLETQANYPW